jgi:hypothetical protein
MSIKPGTLAYLASPYSRFPRGLAEAFIEAARITAKLVRAGVNVYSPIAHTHFVAIYGDLDPLDHSLWLKFDENMMSRADALIVAHMEGWQESVGIAHEIEFFERAGKPIYDLPDIQSCNLIRRKRDSDFALNDCQGERV